MQNPAAQKVDACTWAAWVLMAALLLMILLKGLLGALFAALLVYSLVHQITPLLARRINSERARLVAVAALSSVVVAALTLVIWGIISFVNSDAGNVRQILQKLADIIEQSRAQLPLWVQESLPIGADALRESIVHWVREHAVEAKAAGAEAGRTIAHVIVGMVIGMMVAVDGSHDPKKMARLTTAVVGRMNILYGAFRDMVFAQVWISAINAVVTGVFVLVVLPLFGVSLPLAKSLIAITFFAGLLPVIGNLVSNTVFIIIGLSHSLQMAVVALVFMVVVHKLEYFLNARIIGSSLNAKAWELLAVMLAAETLFGVPGVIAAPVFYAYAKRELIAVKLI
jgi:predicted PurR-regulated permease PerM